MNNDNKKRMLESGITNSSSSGSLVELNSRPKRTQSDPSEGDIGLNIDILNISKERESSNKSQKVKIVEKDGISTTSGNDKCLICFNKFKNQEEVGETDTDETNIPFTPCEICGVGGYRHPEDFLLFCYHCDSAFHMYCLDPPLTEKPNGRWLCDVCRSSRCKDCDVLVFQTPL